VETITAWRDFYLMGGAALATLIGLLFVAMSIHLAEILAVRPLLRNVEVALYGILYQLGFCGFILMPRVTLAEAGIVVITASLTFTVASWHVGSHRSRVDTWINVSFGLLAAPIGILMLFGWAPAMYLYAIVFALSVASLVRLCWRLLTKAITGLDAKRDPTLLARDGPRRVSSR